MAVRKDDAPAAYQATMAILAELMSFSCSGGLIQATPRLIPAARAAALTAGVSLACPLDDKSAVTTEFNGLTAVPLIRRHEPDGTVAVPLVVPVHKRTVPSAGLFLAREGRRGQSGRCFTVRTSDSA
jgi:hypothetical protein